MSGRRWLVEPGTEATWGSGTRDYLVRRPETPAWQAVHVWANPADPASARCVSCTGLLAAMKASCAHALAVRRYLKARQ